MTFSDSFWSLNPFAQSWAPAKPKPPQRRKAVFTQQRIETIGGSGSSSYSALELPPQGPSIGDPRLPVELIVHIVLLAAQDIAFDDDDERSSVSSQLLELACVSRVCHRAVLSTFLLPSLTLSGVKQIRTFAISLDKNRLGIRSLSETRIQSLTFRARNITSASKSYGPALFDASQAQTQFEKQLLPFIRIILSHCGELRTLRIEGVPRGLLSRLDELCSKIESFDCLMGHYGGDLERNFWSAKRWSNLTRLQLHGPRLQLTPSVAAALASLPKLETVGLIVPMVVPGPSTDINSGDESVLLSRALNPLQVLLDRSSSLQELLLVGHAEKDYVGYSDKLRFFMQDLRQGSPGSRVQLKLVTVIRRPESLQAGEEGASKLRLHPCEVSAWMMDRAQCGLQWFEGSNPEGEENKVGDLDHMVETWQAAQYTPPPSTLASLTPSRNISRTGSPMPTMSTGVRSRVVPIDTLSDSEEESFDELD